MVIRTRSSESLSVRKTRHTQRSQSMHEEPNRRSTSRSSSPRRALSTSERPAVRKEAIGELVKSLNSENQYGLAAPQSPKRQERAYRAFVESNNDLLNNVLSVHSKSTSFDVDAPRVRSLPNATEDHSLVDHSNLNEEQRAWAGIEQILTDNESIATHEVLPTEVIQALSKVLEGSSGHAAMQQLSNQLSGALDFNDGEDDARDAALKSVCGLTKGATDAIPELLNASFSSLMTENTATGSIVSLLEAKNVIVQGELQEDALKSFIGGIVAAIAFSKSTSDKVPQTSAHVASSRDVLPPFAPHASSGDEVTEADDINTLDGPSHADESYDHVAAADDEIHDDVSFTLEEEATPDARQSYFDGLFGEKNAPVSAKEICERMNSSLPSLATFQTNDLPSTQQGSSRQASTQQSTTMNHWTSFGDLGFDEQGVFASFAPIGENKGNENVDVGAEVRPEQAPKAERRSRNKRSILSRHGSKASETFRSSPQVKKSTKEKKRSPPKKKKQEADPVAFATFFPAFNSSVIAAPVTPTADRKVFDAFSSTDPIQTPRRTPGRISQFLSTPRMSNKKRHVKKIHGSEERERTWSHKADKKEKKKDNKNSILLFRKKLFGKGRRGSPDSVMCSGRDEAQFFPKLDGEDDWGGLLSES